jgi:methionine-rich copper-binding protein CopC
MQNSNEISKTLLRPGLVVLALILLSSVMQIAISSAHSLLVKSSPEHGAELAQSPQQVTAWFSQELDSKLSTLQVFDADGRQVDNGDGGVDLYDPDHASLIVTLPPGLPNGIYVARWSVVSIEDGDASEGEFTFGVGEAPATGFSLPAQSSSRPKKVGWPVIELAASLGILSIVIVSVSLFIWSSKRS